MHYTTDIGNKYEKINIQKKHGYLYVYIKCKINCAKEIHLLLFLLVGSNLLVRNYMTELEKGYIIWTNNMCKYMDKCSKKYMHKYSSKYIRNPLPFSLLLAVISQEGAIYDRIGKGICNMNKEICSNIARNIRNKCMPQIWHKYKR